MQRQWRPGFNRDKVSDIYLFVEYHYTPRGHHIVTDEFTADTLSQFDVVDDAQATNCRIFPVAL